MQRYGGGLNLNVHFHLLSLDGWFHRASDGKLAFERAPSPRQSDVERLLVAVHARVMRLLEQRGLLEPDAADALAGRPVLARVRSRSVSLSARCEDAPS